MNRAIWAVVPVKNLEDAKQRLAAVLAPEERRSLFRAMLEDVLSAVARARCLGGILVVTRDAEAAALAERYGARILIEEANRGHTAASSFGASSLARERAHGMVQLPADLPLVTPDDIEALLEIHRDAPAVTIAPSHDERGSNAIVCSPPDALPFRFGDDSFFPHLERARSLGIEPAIVRRPGLALDIDTPADLEGLIAAPERSRAQAYLAEIDAAARLGRRVTAPLQP